MLEPGGGRQRSGALLQLRHLEVIGSLARMYLKPMKADADGVGQAWLAA